MKYGLLLFLILFHTKTFCKELPSASISQVESIRQKLSLHPQCDSARAKLLLLLSWELKSSQSDSALKFANEALEIANTLNRPAIAASAEDNIGVIYQIKTDYKQALIHHSRALEIARKDNMLGLIASAEDNLGIIYQIKADFRQALFYHLRALRINEQQNNAARRAKTLNNIGQVYFMLKKYEQSLYYYKQAIAFIMSDTTSNRDATLVAYYNNIAGSYAELQQTEKAIYYYDKSNELSLIVNGQPNGIACINLAERYVNQKQIQKAEYYCNEAFKISNGNPYLQYTCYFTLGRVTVLKGNYDEALRYFSRSEKISKDAGILWQQADPIYEMALVYEKKNDYKRAYQYFREYHEALKATLNETYTKQINEMQAKYDAGVKDEQIKRLSHAKEMIEAENERSRLMNYFMIFSFVSVCVIGIVIARNLILKQRISNKVLSEKNAITQLQKEQVERANMVLVAEKIAAQYEVLKSKINPHFLFNSLSTLSSLIAKSKESALHFVDNFSELYRRILETTEQQLISLEDEVEVVKRYLFLQQIEFGKNLYVQMEIAPHFLKQKVPPFSLQMVVENAIKHNIISGRQPLHINIFVLEKSIVVENTLQLRRNKIESTGIAVKNICARYKLVSDIQPTFEELERQYKVTLPLLDN